MSDTHFEDPDCFLMNPGWVSPQEQVNIINKYVMPSDTLILLGDIGNPIWMNEIKCRNRILIMGNHDVTKTKFLPYFTEIYEGAVFIAEKILLSHEPILNPNWLNIHGHVHNSSPFNIMIYGEPREDEIIGINVAADVVNYTPININKDIIKKGYLKKITSVHRETIDNANLFNKKGKSI